VTQLGGYRSTLAAVGPDHARMPADESPHPPSMLAMLEAFNWPSEAFWRRFELMVLRGQPMASPVLELGCGNGAFTELARLRVDEAIDLSRRSVAIAARRRSTYANVRCMDIRALGDEFHRSFGTVFANSVLEHIPGVEEILTASARLLVPGGRLITTVPLIDMNEHLCVRREWYAEWRRSKLQHHNLWPLASWIDSLQAAGFSNVEHFGYLDPASCRFWDAIDLVGSIGVGRLRVSTAIRYGIWPLLPATVKSHAKRRVAAKLDQKFQEAEALTARPSAALLVARKS
jgi:SAM-dependent methyltransferase